MSFTGSVIDCDDSCSLFTFHFLPHGHGERYVRLQQVCVLCLYHIIPMCSLRKLFPPKYSVAVIQCRHMPCQFAMTFQWLLSSRNEHCPVHLSILVSHHLHSDLCVHLFCFFHNLHLSHPHCECVSIAIFFSYMILRIQFRINCLLPLLAAVNLPTNTCCAGGYLSTPPSPPHTELVTC